MSIGVVTYSNTISNYGEVLQYLATQEFLKQFDNDVFLLREKKKKKTKFKKIISLFFHFFKEHFLPNSRNDINKQKATLFKSWRITSERMEKKHPRHFELFRKKYFKIIEDDGSFFKGKIFDAVCVGSDQTWTSDPYIYFLEFAPQKSIRFSIAPSIGHLSVTNEFANKVRNALSKFLFITVREKSGLKLCQKAGRLDAHLVLDPTFLISKNNYESFAAHLPKGKPYIFLYLLGAEITLDVQKIFDFAKKNDLDIKYVASQGRDDLFPKIHATVEEWLALMTNADYVVTNSFHGTAFSIINHKKFIVFPIEGILSSMNERIEYITNYFDLKDRVYSGNLDKLFNSINWDKADNCIENNRELMVSLMQSLTKKINKNALST